MKEELMLLCFISLLLTATLSIISNICIPSKFYDSAFTPCTKREVDEERETNGSNERKLLMALIDPPRSYRRVLTALNRNTCKEDYEPFGMQVLNGQVPGCIVKLGMAGIKIWVLTGDKIETAINIGYACSLLKEDMKQIVITLDSQDISDLEKQGDKVAVSKSSNASITRQIDEGKSQLSSPEASSTSFGLIIDGKSLAFALTEHLEKPFLDLAVQCKSVICFRATPKQKDLVTRLVKKGTGKTTLAIGDGANDVGMLQELISELASVVLKECRLQCRVILP